MTAESLTIEKIPGTPPQLSKQDLGELSLLYARVFAGEPWNEYTACLSEGTFFGQETRPGQACPNSSCDAKLTMAYPPESTAEYIVKELDRPDAALFLLRDTNNAENSVVGFSWGFRYASPEEFAEAKYQTPEMQLVVGGLLRSINIGNNGIWYLSESGIEDDPRYRGKGWSRVFHDKRLEVAESVGLDALQRTSCYGNMYRTSKKTMLQIMGLEARIDPSVNHLKLTGNTVNNIEDTENASRVLFVRRSS